jgi:hypothetical protein
MIAEHADEVRVRRYSDVPECDIVVAIRGLEMSGVAMKQSNGHGSNAKSYRIAGGFSVAR